MMLLTFDDMPPQPSKPSSNLPYVVAVMIMVGLGVGAVLVVTALRPSEDNAALIATILGFIAPTTMALLAFMKAQETHLSVNSRLDAFMTSARQVGRLEGEQAGYAAGVVEGVLRIRPTATLPEHPILPAHPIPPLAQKGEPNP